MCRTTFGIAVVSLALRLIVADTFAATGNGAAPQPGPTVLFVATNGNDAWSGRLPAPNDDKSDGPFATIARARDAIRGINVEQRALKRPIAVFVRGGTYFLGEPLDGVSLLPLFDGRMQQRPKPIPFWVYPATAKKSNPESYLDADALASTWRTFRNDRHSRARGPSELRGHATLVDNRYKLHKLARNRFELYDCPQFLHYWQILSNPSEASIHAAGEKS